MLTEKLVILFRALTWCIKEFPDFPTLEKAVKLAFACGKFENKNLEISMVNGYGHIIWRNFRDDAVVIKTENYQYKSIQVIDDDGSLKALVEKAIRLAL